MEASLVTDRDGQEGVSGRRDGHGNVDMELLLGRVEGASDMGAGGVVDAFLDHGFP